MTVRTVRVFALSLTAALAALWAGCNLSPAFAAGSDFIDTRFGGFGPVEPDKQAKPPSTGKPSSRVGDKKKSPADKKDTNDKKSELEQLNEGYKAARLLILDGKYEAGINAMHALGHDDHPDVANYIGYAFRKLGDYDDSKVWYEKALAGDPNHVRTWSYYGMWQMEQGNRLKAEDFLQKVKLLCGTTDCREYTELKAVIDGKASY